MNIKFNSKIDSLLKEYNRGVLNMQNQNQHGDTFDPEDDTYTGSTADTDEAIPGEEGEEQKTDRQKDIESLKALRANPDKRHAEKNALEGGEYRGPVLYFFLSRQKSKYRGGSR